MNLFQVIIAWFSFAAQLASLAVGQSSDSPPFWFTYGDGRKFMVNFHATREG